MAKVDIWTARWSIILTLLVVGLLVWTQGNVRAEESPRKPVFGLVGITPAQIACLNVYNGSRKVTIVEMQFVDNASQLLLGERTELAPGESALLKLDGVELLGRDDFERLKIRAHINVFTEKGRGIPITITTVANVEIVDKTTKKTDLYIHPLPRQFH